MDNFLNYSKKTGEWGEVVEIVPPLLKVAGLPKAKMNELIQFENQHLGQVIGLNKSSIDVLSLSEHSIKVGEKVMRLDKNLTIGVGDDLLGQVINPLGLAYFEAENTGEIKEERPIEIPVGSIQERARIDKTLLTGVSIIDLAIPLGKGQKELIIGDRTTGKTSFILTTIKNQALQGTIIVYAMIGKKKTDARKLIDYFSKEKILDKSVIVVSCGDDPVGSSYLAPFSAMTISEYFKDKGKDVLLILDDLTTHAKLYREISLVEGKFPGRESYPADIIYLYARLLERAGSFKQANGTASTITCLPITESVEGDMTGFISTNIMGITDGHIFFDSDLYNQGRRPAINIQLSVTRVGKQTQAKLSREIAQEILAFLTQHEKIKNYSHFGTELSAKVKKDIKKGDQLLAFFDQTYEFIVPHEIQILLFALIWLDFFMEKDDEYILKARDTFTKLYTENKRFTTLLDKALSVDSIYKLLSIVFGMKTDIEKYVQ